MSKTYYIRTFGCQMNLSDSERIVKMLEKRGCKKAASEKLADLILVNVCSVRQSAVDRAYAIVNRNAGKYIILAGCVLEKDRKKLKNKVAEFWKPSDYFNNSPCYENKFRAYVPIMTGCNNFCSYCVVPYARGREVSRPVDEIIKEIRSLIKKGCKEIVLLGQNVNSYNSRIGANKKRIGANVNFSRLLQKINSIPGNFWTRFLTSHPKDMSDEMIETIAKCKKVCEYVHLPVQSGDDEILKKMNRHYTVKQYLNLIKKIKSAFAKIHGKFVPISVSTDIIVGFPGETRKQFAKSADIMKKVKYDMVYFGRYSPRPGTAAWRLKDNVSKKEKERREKYLNEILKKTNLENNKKYLGRTFEILVFNAKPSQNQGLALKTVYFGRTRTMKNVKFLSNKRNLVGQFVKVKITKANIWNLEGKLL